MFLYVAQKLWEMDETRKISLVKHLFKIVFKETESYVTGLIQNGYLSNESVINTSALTTGSNSSSYLNNTSSRLGDDLHSLKRHVKKYFKSVIDGTKKSLQKNGPDDPKTGFLKRALDSGAPEAYFNEVLSQIDQAGTESDIFDIL